jgi:hypothetical protein
VYCAEHAVSKQSQAHSVIRAAAHVTSQGIKTVLAIVTQQG